MSTQNFPTAGLNTQPNRGPQTQPTTVPLNRPLMAASFQWSTRPAHERFDSIESAHAAALKLRAQSVLAEDIPMTTIKVEASGRDVVVIGSKGKPARVSHWVFGQLSQRAEAPAGYLRTLPAEMAVENLNYGLQRANNLGNDKQVNLYMYKSETGPYTVRSIDSDIYTRIYYSDITERLVHLKHSGDGWQEAPAAFDGCRGQYVGPDSQFHFFVDNGRRIFESDPGGGLSRGFFLRNTEIAGKASLIIDSFLYQYVCGNHMVWGAQMASQFKIRHIGNADGKTFKELQLKLKRYSEASAVQQEQQIQTARVKLLGTSKEEVLDTVFGFGIQGLTRRHIEAGYAKAEEHSSWYGDPRSAWGMVSGMTEVSRDSEYLDDRDVLDRAAGKVLERVAF